jgi:diguanylate cyclase (GGDEF)-like protein
MLDIAAGCVGAVGVVGVWAWGAPGGFQHDLIVLPPLLMLQARWHTALRLAAVLLLMAAYLALDAAGPAWALPQDAAALLYRLNAVVGLSLLSAMAWVWAGQLRSAQDRLQRSVATDPLTGLMTRRSWIDGAERVLAARPQGQRHTAVGLLIVGVDHLRLVNDRHGHGTGDLVLGTVAAALQHGLRERDLLARWGGDHFIALLADNDAKTLRMVGERLRALVQAATVRVAETREVLALTASMGITEVDVGEPLGAAIARADKAMGEAKQAGRNRVVVARA